MRSLGRNSRTLKIVLLAVGVLVVAALAAGAVALVVGGGGDSESESLQTDFREPEEFELAQVYSENDFTCTATDTACVRSYLVGITGRYGPRASLPILERLQKEKRVELSVNDHDLAHAVGRETAANFGSNFESFDLCPTIFNYGCPHGFFEYVLARTDTPKEAAASVCETAGNADKRLLISGFSCYHGVGHGVMMAQAYDLHASLATCNTLDGKEAQDGCWQGVFMENVNAAMTNRARKGVFSPQRPLAPCDSVGKKYKHECYINHAGWMMRVAENSVPKASGYCMRVRGADRRACMQSIGLMVTNPVWQAPLAPELAGRPQDEIAAKLCERFPAPGRTDCVIAGVDNLANFDQFEVGRQGEFCAEVAAPYRTACYRQIGVNLRNRTQDQSLISDRCGQLGANTRACLSGAGAPA